MKIKRMKNMSDEWRVGNLYYDSPVMGMVDKIQSVTIKPNESARRVEREIAKDLSCPPERVYLVAGLDAD